MIAEALKLSVFFGEELTAGGELASGALMRLLAQREIPVAVLLRGAEGFGAHKRIHAERFPDVSTDLPLLLIALGERSQIEALLPDLDALIEKGLVTLEATHLASGEEVAGAQFPEGPGSAGKLTVYCGRAERSGGQPAFRVVIELLRRYGAPGAIAFLGIDGMLHSRRREARLFSTSASTPMAIEAIGPRADLRAALGALSARLQHPIITLEPIEQLKHDGALLGGMPRPDAEGRGEGHAEGHAEGRGEGEARDGGWQMLSLYTRRSARVGGHALYSELTRQLRQLGGAGATTLFGEWGFSSDEPAHGDRFGRLSSHLPSCTICIDRGEKLAELWPLIDELTAEHGILTCKEVLAYQERRAAGPGEAEAAPRRAQGVSDESDAARLPVTIERARAGRAAPSIAAQAQAQAQGEREQGEQEGWVQRFNAQVRSFAEARGSRQAFVRVTLLDGEQFFLQALEEGPSAEFLTLHPHPEHHSEMVAGVAQGPELVPRVLVLPHRSILQLELLSSPPRGTRSLVGYRLAR